MTGATSLSGPLRDRLDCARRPHLTYFRDVWRAFGRLSFQTVIKWPKQLVVFWVVITAISVAALVGGLRAEGEPRVVYTTGGVLGLACLLTFLIFWLRASRRR